MITTHKVGEISFGQNSIILEVDGEKLEIPFVKISQKLNDASDLERKFYKISPSGYGIHWPLIDEDLAIDALIKVAESNN